MLVWYLRKNKWVLSFRRSPAPSTDGCRMTEKSYSINQKKILAALEMTRTKMQQQNTYKKSTLTKIFFALTFLISLSFFPGVGGNSALAFQQEIKTELVVFQKVKTPEWTKPFHKKFKLKTFTKSPASKKYEAGFLLAYNKLTEIKFKNLSRKYSLIKSPGIFIRVKIIPQSSEDNYFIPYAG